MPSLLLGGREVYRLTGLHGSGAVCACLVESCAGLGQRPTLLLSTVDFSAAFPVSYAASSFFFFFFSFFRSCEEAAEMAGSSRAGHRESNREGCAT